MRQLLDAFAEPSRIRQTCTAVMLALVAQGTFAQPSPQPSPFQSIQDLINVGRMKDAYELARQSEDQLGDANFDFLYGLSALESGHAAAGVLALERVVSAYPDNQSARLELARAYFILGEDARALTEFNGVLTQNPPALVRDNIARFLDAIRARQTAYNVTTRGFIEAGFGRDSNVNAGPARNFALPSGAQFTITDSNALGQSTYLIPYTVGASVSVPFRPGRIASISVSLDGRSHNGATRFEQGSRDVSAGLSILDEDNLFRLTAGYSEFILDNDRYRNSSTISGEYQRQLDVKNIVSLFLQTSDLGYEGTNSIRDGKTLIAGASLRHALLDIWATQLSTSVFHGRDLNANGRHDFSRDLIGMRIGVSTAPHPRWVLSTGLSYSSSRYFSPDQSFIGAINQNPFALALNGPEPDTKRDDTTRGIDFSATWLASKNVSVRFDGTHSRNESGIDVYSWRRSTYNLKARYEFF